MNRVMKTVTAVTLGLATSMAVAAPKELITHNNTDVESGAFVAGVIPPQHPTKPHSERRIAWPAVRLACFGHATNGTCWAIIKMATNTANPIELGKVTINLESGEITPAQMSSNGYTFSVIGPGETLITQNN